ncbi:MAG: glycosyltransferase family 4 protein [Spirochaetota bacterium]|jgi:glycosyltransferase involved in cell wall biosynthesis|nr:glycosyltransferase family 4 protein [Spirochaetota bacterium]
MDSDQRVMNSPPGLPAKIRIISDGRFPSYDTNTQQILKSASALARTGLDVELCIVSRNRYNFYRAARFRALLMDYYAVRGPLKIKRSHCIPAGRFRPERITHGILSPFCALFRGVKIFYSRDPIPVLLALLLRRYVIFETYRCLGNEYPRLMRRLARFSRARHFLGIITHSRLAADSIIQAGFPPDKLAAMHNGFDPEDMQPVLTRSEARRLTNLPEDKFLLVYTGNMHICKGLETIVEIAAKRPALCFVLVGGGPEEDIARLTETVRIRKIENIIFTGRRPISEVSNYLYAADVLLIPPTAAPLEKSGRVVLPFKTFLYLAAGRAILAAGTPDLLEVLDERCALLVPPDDEAAALAAVDRLHSSPELCALLAEGAKEAASHLTWDARGRKIAQWITERFTQKST